MTPIYGGTRFSSIKFGFKCSMGDNNSSDTFSLPSFRILGRPNSWRSVSNERRRNNKESTFTGFFLATVASTFAPQRSIRACKRCSYAMMSVRFVSWIGLVCTESSLPAFLTQKLKGLGRRLVITTSFMDNVKMSTGGPMFESTATVYSTTVLQGKSS